MTINVKLKHYKGLALDTGTHFFGAPCLPNRFARRRFFKEEMFVGQINLKDLAPADGSEVFPKSGMLYFFYDIFEHNFTVLFSKSEGEVLKEDFNRNFDFGSFTTPLKAEFSVPSDATEEAEYGEKLLCPVPQMVKDAYPKYAEGYRCLALFCPPHFDYFKKQFLLNVKNYSCALISEKNLAAKRFSAVETVNI